jgi:hypothetical protein
VSTSFTYDTLKSEVRAAVEDPSIDLDTLIRLGEDMCVVDLSLDIWVESLAMTLPLDSQEADLPEDMLKVFAVFYTRDANRVFLEPRSYEYIIDYWPSTTEKDVPYYWSHYGATKIYFAPTAANDYAATARGLKRPVSLVIDTAGTWLSQNAGRLLYLATIINVEQFSVSDERIEMWKKEYADELQRKRIEFRHMITPEYMLPQMRGEQ